MDGIGYPGLSARGYSHSAAVAVSTTRQPLEGFEAVLGKVWPISIPVSVTSSYERDEITPSIDLARKLITNLNTIISYLLNEFGKETV